MRVLSVGMAPFVRHNVIGSNAVTVIRRCAIPVCVRTSNRGIIVDSSHIRACGVVRVAAEGVEEVIVGLSAEVDDILLVSIQRAGEGITFLPDLVASVLFVDYAVKGIMDQRDSVDD